MSRRLARWLFWNVPLPSWMAPHVLAIALGAKRYGRVDKSVDTVEKSANPRGDVRG